MRWFSRLAGEGGWRVAGVSVALGAASALALPPLHVIPVLALTIPALLMLVAAAPTVGAAFRRGFWFGLGHHLIGLYWITEAILLESARYWWFVPIAVPALASVLALFIAVPCATARKAPGGWRRIAVFAGVWVIADLARQFIGTGFPWNPLGSTWAIPGEVGTVMLQPVAWIGTPGLTLLTLGLAALPSLGVRGMVAAACGLAVWAAGGVLRLQHVAPEPPGLAVVLVQGNVPQGQKWDRSRAEAVFARMLALSSAGVRAAGATPSVVIWPETASVYLLEADPGARAAVAEAITPARGAIIGSLTFANGTPSADPANEPFNSMVALRDDGQVAAVYDKWHLVPFGEYAPGWVPLAIQIVPGHFGFGKGPDTLTIPGIPAFGGLICYEAIFPGQVIDAAHRPDWIVNITNDAWFGNSTGPRQHLAASRMRAIEEGLPLMRAANTGISAGFDGFGRELGRLGLGQAGALTLGLPGHLPAPLFARYGLAVPATLAILCILLCLPSYRRRAVMGRSAQT